MTYIGTPTSRVDGRAKVTGAAKYAAEYKFDWLMIAAQAYQESQIDQSKVSPAGAVGVMQIKPETAAGDPIDIKNVDKDMEKNINAGVKYMHFIINNYFKDTKMNKMNRGLFAFASYNAGPNRIARLRKQAEREGLDPNKWFDNVELIVNLANHLLEDVFERHKSKNAAKFVHDQRHSDAMVPQLHQ